MSQYWRRSQTAPYRFLTSHTLTESASRGGVSRRFSFSRFASALVGRIDLSCPERRREQHSRVSRHFKTGDAVARIRFANASRVVGSSSGRLARGRCDCDVDAMEATVETESDSASEAIEGGGGSAKSADVSINPDTITHLRSRLSFRQAPTRELHLHRSLFYRQPESQSTLGSAIRCQ